MLHLDRRVLASPIRMRDGELALKVGERTVVDVDLQAASRRKQVEKAANLRLSVDFGRRWRLNDEQFANLFVAFSERRFESPNLLVAFGERAVEALNVSGSVGVYS